MTDILESEIEQVRLVLEHNDEWASCDCEIRPLSGGAAHKNYIATAGDARAVVKIWNGYWEEVGVIPPASTILENTLVAARLGVGANVIAISDEPHGIALEFLTGDEPSLREDHDALPSLVQSLRQLHSSGERFANDLNPFDHIRTLVASIRQRGFVLPSGFEVAESALAEIEAVLDLRSQDFVPCHNDLWDANVIRETSTGRFRLIDWDLAGNTDPCYEIGFIAAQNNFNRARTREFVTEYYQTSDEQVLARIRLFMFVAHMSNTVLWAVAQGNAAPNDTFDYGAALAESWQGALNELHADDHMAMRQSPRGRRPDPFNDRRNEKADGDA